MINYKKNNLIKIISILFIVLFIFSINSVKAIDINPNLPGAVVPNTNNNPCTSIINFYWFAIFISGILAFGAIVYGGIKYQLAAGNPSGESEGKKWITGALEGLLLLFSAYLILKIINPNLTKCQLPELSPVKTQNINFKNSTVNNPLVLPTIPKALQPKNPETPQQKCSAAGGRWVLSVPPAGVSAIIATATINGIPQTCIVMDYNE
jgi:hypothetical protein